jgi:threonine dehydrogenase-like Zn-dependent dehydrogenase
LLIITIINYGILKTVKFGASKVFTTAGTDDKVKYLTELTKGGAHAINYKTQNFEEEIKKVDGEGVDLIVDFVGPDYWNKVSPIEIIPPVWLEEKAVLIFIIILDRISP